MPTVRAMNVGMSPETPTVQKREFGSCQHVGTLKNTAQKQNMAVIVAPRPYEFGGSSQKQFHEIHAIAQIEIQSHSLLQRLELCHVPNVHLPNEPSRVLGHVGNNPEFAVIGVGEQIEGQILFRQTVRDRDTIAIVVQIHPSKASPSPSHSSPVKARSIVRPASTSKLHAASSVQPSVQMYSKMYS